MAIFRRKDRSLIPENLSSGGTASVFTAPEGSGQGDDDRQWERGVEEILAMASG